MKKNDNYNFQFFYVKYITVALLLFNSFCLYPQNSNNKRIISYDLKKKVIDTLDYVDFDKDIVSDNTEFNVGAYSNAFNSLDMNVPEDYLYPGTHFTYKQKVSDYYDITDFPARTAVKLYRMGVDGILRQVCSGSIIGPRYVLTACHCVMAGNLDIVAIMFDFFVSPAFDNGEHNTNFNCSWVDKIYILEGINWANGNDLALLELSESIGNQTGWLGFGFDKSNTIKDGIFYKFSYPGRTEPTIDTRSYNGDTLYFNYGLTDRFTTNEIGISNASAVAGESGSPLILVENEEKYIVYGTLSWSTMGHCRIRDIMFYPFKSIIESNSTNNTTAYPVFEVKIYPNPVTDKLHYEFPVYKDIHIRLYNLLGMRMFEELKSSVSFGEIDFSSLMPGAYFIIITSDSEKYVYKVIKK